MKLAIMQPYFFPYLGYFQAIKAVDKYILYENLDYITEGWMHRNRILVKNQNPIYINANIISKSSNKKINEIELVQNNVWKKKLLNSINLNYRGSAYFHEIFCLIEKLVKTESKFLLEYNANIIKEVCLFLEIKTSIISDNKHYLQLETNLNSIDSGDYSQFPDLLLTKPIKKVARVIEICKIENAKTFINAIGGQALYSKDEFNKYGIELFFVKTEPFEYKQFSKSFIPNLSIIDVLMHNGKEKTKELINNYNLI
jgi:hypothetical protein